MLLDVNADLLRDDLDVEELRSRLHFAIFPPPVYF